MAARPVTDEERDAYERDGVVILRGIYPLEWVDQLRTALDEVFARDRAEGEVQGTLTGASHTGDRTDMVEAAARVRGDQPGADIAVDGNHPPAGRSLVETDAAHWHGGLRRHHVDGPLPGIVASLTRSDEVTLYSDQVFLKEPGSAVRTPWHQDKPYFLMQGEKAAVCWVPVDAVTVENGAMGYVLGSHRWGQTFQPSDFVTRTNTFPEVGGISLDGLDPLPPIDAEPERYPVRYFDAAPGDVIVHNWATIHGSTGNTHATAMRRAASVRYAGDDITFFRRASSPEPFRNTVSLRDGEPLANDPRFPRVWP